MNLLLGEVSKNKWEAQGKILDNCIVKLSNGTRLRFKKFVFKSKNGTLKRITLEMAMTLKDEALTHLQEMADSQGTLAGFRSCLMNGGDRLLYKDLCWIKSKTEFDALILRARKKTNFTELKRRAIRERF